MSATEIKKLERLAWLLDSSIRVPGTRWRIGLDGLVGLIPGVGDLLAGAASSYILLQAVRLGVPWAVSLRMALNIVLESLVGVIPVFGDLFDFAFKANQRNVQLMLDYFEQPVPTNRRSTTVLVITVLAIVAMLVLIVWLLIALLAALIAALN
ncbi:DUF4112 domain-containing protein [Thiosocius teredinicola]|uniref:DUF4112 domain-containing protein n=1 Tax=Thiosocius teredinicola TaxID=1973002 RepID=UPI0009912E6D